MNDARIIPTTGESSVVTYAILIDGKELPQTIEVLSISTEREANRIPCANLVIRDGDIAAEDFPVCNEKFFEPGNKIEIKVGHAAKEKTIFKGMVIKQGLKVRSQGMSALTVECRDEAVRMTVGRKSKFFTKKKDSEVFSELINSNKLKSDVAATNVVHPELVQYDATDWDFMVSRAEVNGMLVFVDDGKVSVQPPKLSGKADLSILLGDTIFEFDAEMDARHQFKSVKAHGWDQSTQKVVTKQGKPSKNAQGNIAESKLADALGLKSFDLRHTGQIKNLELKTWADAKLTRSSLSKIIGRARIPGYALVKPGQLVDIGGVSKRFNGIAFVAAVRHEVTDGEWRTDIQFGISPERFASKPDVNDAPAAGLLPAPHGLLIGKATALEGDPEGEDRIQVTLPMVDPDAKGIWARWIAPDAGANRGMFFRPEIGDELIVGFLNQDPRDPVILGMVHSSKHPAPIKLANVNHEKAIVTRSKMRIHFDDEKKIVTVDTPGGNSVTISDDKQAITMKDQHGNSIKMDKDGITLDGSKITLKAKQEISIKAGTDLKAESGTKTAIKAGTQLKAEGAAGAELSTSAIAIVKGSLVKIN